MDFLENIIPLLIVVSIIVSIVNKAKKAQGKTTGNTTASKPSQTTASSANKVQTLQEIIRQQIEEQRNAVTGQKNVSAVPKSTAQKPYIGEGNYTSPASLENTPVEMQRHSHNAHGGRPSYNEGDALNRTSLENTPVEMQRHSHRAHGGRPSYNEGDALNRKTLEGQPNELDKITSVSKRTKKASTGKNKSSKSFDFKINQNSIVSGIIMSEILNSRGGRKASR